jgi:hypothetical protein
VLSRGVFEIACLRKRRRLGWALKYLTLKQYRTICISLTRLACHDRREEAVKYPGASPLLTVIASFGT